MKLYCVRVDWLELKTLKPRRFLAAVSQISMSCVPAGYTWRFTAATWGQKSNNQSTNLNKNAPRVFERSTDVTLNLMFAVYVVASCVRLIGHCSSGWSVISTTSLFFSPPFFCCWHCCREKRPPSSFGDWAAEGKKKLQCPGAWICSERVTQNTQKTAKKLWHIDRQVTVKWPAAGI